MPPDAMADANAAAAAPAHANPDPAAGTAGADAGAAAKPVDNPDAASDAVLAARAEALVAALRSGDGAARVEAAKVVKRYAASKEIVEVWTPDHPRAVAALEIAGAASALAQLLRSSDEVVKAAADALGDLMLISAAARRTVIDSVGVDAFMQLFRDNQDKEQLSFLTYMLRTLPLVALA